MKRSIPFMATAALLWALTLVLAGNGPEAPAPTRHEAPDLRNQVQELQTRVNSLETRVRNLEATVEKLKAWPPPPEIPQPSPLHKPRYPSGYNVPLPEPGPGPKIWGQREINGWTFYLTPCDSGLPGQRGSGR